MVRVLYLIEIDDRGYRERLMQATLDGEKWPKMSGKGLVTDADMVKAAARLHGWAQSVYKFGCAFIHLSANHDRSVRDPFKALPAREQADILQHLRQYHGGPLGVNVSFPDVVAYLPQVYDKIAGNLRRHVDELKAKHGH